MADIIEWVPGFIESEPDMCWGLPHLTGRRLSINAAKSVFEKPPAYDVSTLEATILYAFARGAEWQRSKRRRKQATPPVGSP